MAYLCDLINLNFNKMCHQNVGDLYIILYNYPVRDLKALKKIKYNF